MSAIRTWTLTAEELVGEFNKVKNILLAYLAEKEFLSEEDAEELMLTRQIVVKEPSAICELYRRILGKEADQTTIMVVEGKRFGKKEEKKDDC